MNTQINTFSSLVNDLTFKNVFSHEEVLKYLVDLIFKYINTNETYNVYNVIPQSYIKPRNKEYSSYFGDITAVLSDNSIVSLECYKDKFNQEKLNKSFCYACRLYDGQVKKGYKDIEQVYSINFIKGKYEKEEDKILYKYVYKDNESNKEIDCKLITIILIRFDLVEKIAYNKKEEKLITLLRMLNAKTLEELEYYSKLGGDKEMNDVVEYVREWNLKSAEGGFERYVKNKMEEAAFEAEEKDKITYAKGMLDYGMPVEAIHNITGLSISKINKLKK